MSEIGIIPKSVYRWMLYDKKLWFGADTGLEQALKYFNDKETKRKIHEYLAVGYWIFYGIKTEEWRQYSLIPKDTPIYRRLYIKFKGSSYWPRRVVWNIKMFFAHRDLYFKYLYHRFWSKVAW